MKGIKYIISTLLLAVASTACNDTVVSSVPDSRVYMEINLSTAEYNKLQSSLLYSIQFERELKSSSETGWVLVTSGTSTTRRQLSVTEGVGYSGMIIINGFDYNIYSYDMCCPYEHKKAIKVRISDTGKAKCDSCKTVYDLGYGIGNPESGPSKEALRRYKTMTSGNTLYITR